MLAIIGILLAQAAVLGWVLVRRRGMRPILVVNLLFAAGISVFVWPYLADEIAYIWRGRATELFDYKNSILAVFGLAMVAASVFAWRGWRPAEIAAWIGFAGNFVLSLMAIQFVLTFKFKCCGYL